MSLSEDKIITNDQNLTPSVEWPMRQRIYSGNTQIKMILHTHASFATFLPTKNKYLFMIYYL